jgi:hypothetical protein
VTKKNGGPRKARTYFEQIPVHAVKKVAGVDVFRKEAAGNDDVVVERASGKTKPQVKSKV